MLAPCIEVFGGIRLAVRPGFFNPHVQHQVRPRSLIEELGWQIIRANI